MTKTYSINNMNIIAKERNGECLSDTYKNAKSKLKWRCAKGHEWEAIPDSVKRGSWCPYCAGRHQTIEDMQQIAKERGGQCLSEEYYNSHTKLIWRCNEGHEWKNTPSHIKSGQWCKICRQKEHFETRKHTIEDMQELAKEKGGQCLSKNYINANSKLTWKCKEGHIWKTTPAHIKSGQWCPVCSKGIGERITRKIFETLFNEKFPTKKPKWLIFPESGNRMELDGYSEKLKIAFEYQGQQHYKEHKQFFHKNKNFEEQLKRDKVKRELCENNDINLFEIPFSIPFEVIGSYILKKLNERKIEIPNVNLDIFDYKNLKNVFNRGKIEEYQLLAKERGGKCISSYFLGDHEKIRWMCEHGHTWEATPSSIKYGNWCPVCVGRNRTIEDMKKIARDRGGECLSEEYNYNKTPMEWKCEKGHVWKTKATQILEGHWCLVCGGSTPLNIKEMKIIAKKRGGECLSETYVNNRTPLKWKCSKDHIWEAKPSEVKQGTWCPICSGNVRLTIEKMRKIANERGGECLSNYYVNNNTPLTWKCIKGHIWKATPGNIKSGKWCPVCGGSKKLTIEKMKEIAKERGGDCISDEYLNSQTKLIWRCKDGHKWEATPNSVKRGTWCPVCWKKKVKG